MPKISIITTTYKHEKFIAQAIESVLGQSFADWELLIGDDNSPDNTFEIAQSYADRDSRIRVWRNESNIGIVGNMNMLARYISPWIEYITFLEWDDVYTSENLQLKINVFEKYWDVWFVYSNFIKIDSCSHVIQWWHRHIKEWKMFFSSLDFLSLGNPIQSFWVVAMRASLWYNILPISTPKWDAVGMYWPLDYWLWADIVPNRWIYYIDKPIFQYRIHANNFVKNKAIMNIQFKEIYEALIIKYREDKAIVRVCHFFIENNSMMTAFFSHSAIKVWQHGMKSFFYNQNTFVITRIAVMLASFFPWIFIDWLYQKYRQ
jgi:glycosyltransferase involved in cell wall biosynthesis